MYDHIFGTGTGWGSCFPAGGDFEIDYTVTQCAALHVYPAGNPDLLEFNPTTKQYLYAFNDLVGGGVPTMYSRRIRVVQASPSETVVQSVVSWSTGAFTSQSVNLEDHFYNWYP
jgi:hypothetical protein